MLDDTTVATFKASFRGELIGPADEGYDGARKVYNGMIDRRPRLIARCVNVADVIAAVNFGRTSGVRVSIRGGGHNAAGLGVCDDGLVIDLSRMKGIRVDPAARTVRVDGGCTWGDVDHASHAFGLAVPAGIISTTGVGGLALGGGLGHLTRKCGLTIDNILAADVVLADGTFVTASAEENQELHWAIRGGGGNFGVVTSFLFRAHPVHTVYAGPMLWELQHAADTLRWYGELIAKAPDELNGFYAFLVVPPAAPFPEPLHNRRMCGVVWCYTGPPEKAEEVFRPIRAFRPVALDWVAPIPYPALQSMFDPIYPPGLQWYWKADFVNDLNEESIALHVRHGSALPTMHSAMHLYPVNGAAARVAASATPWAYRGARWSSVIVGVDPDPANKDLIVRWAKDYFEALHPHSAGGAYVNFMMDEGEERVKATYGANFGRLAAVKEKYDPANLFRVNQNIRPSA